MAKKTKIDYAEMAHQQLLEDRKTILEFYEKFKDQVVTLQDLAVNGPNLTKCLELMNKQTAQLIEFSKAEDKKNNTSDDTLTFEDTEELYEEIQAAKDDNREH